MGIEAATIPAGNIKEPEKTISKGTKIGVGLVIFLYLFSSFSLFGVLSPTQVAESQAPFNDAANLIFGINTGYFVAAGACLASFGALNGWILLQGQIPYSMAKDGLLPKILAYKKYADAAKAKAMEITIEYALTDGQKIASQLGYVPLPANVIAKVAAAADQISPDYKISVGATPKTGN